MLRKDSKCVCVFFETQFTFDSSQKEINGERKKMIAVPDKDVPSALFLPHVKCTVTNWLDNLLFMQHKFLQLDSKLNKTERRRLSTQTLFFFF